MSANLVQKVALKVANYTGALRYLVAIGTVSANLVQKVALKVALKVFARTKSVCI